MAKKTMSTMDGAILTGESDSSRYRPRAKSTVVPLDDPLLGLAELDELADLDDLYEEETEAMTLDGEAWNAESGDEHGLASMEHPEKPFLSGKETTPRVRPLATIIEGLELDPELVEIDLAAISAG